MTGSCNLAFIVACKFCVEEISSAWLDYFIVRLFNDLAIRIGGPSM